MNERLREALRRKIAEHNRLVRLSTIAGGVAIVLMWGAIYCTSWWLTVLGATAAQGLEAEAPREFDRIIAVLFGAWVIAGWIARRFKFFDPRRLDSSAAAKVLELLLTPPRATFAVLQNVRNGVRFNHDDLIAATDFLVRVVRCGKLPLTAVPVELPDENRRARVMNGLQLLDLIYLRKKDELVWVAVSHPQRLIKFLEPSLPGSSC